MIFSDFFFSLHAQLLVVGAEISFFPRPLLKLLSKPKQYIMSYYLFHSCLVISLTLISVAL